MRTTQEGEENLGNEDEEKMLQLADPILEHEKITFGLTFNAPGVKLVLNSQNNTKTNAVGQTSSKVSKFAKEWILVTQLTDIAMDYSM